MTKIEKDTTACFRVDKELWRESRAYAVKHGISTKKLIEFLLQKELKENRILTELKGEES